MNPSSKYKWIRPGLYTTFDKVAVILFGLINFVILTRMLSKDEFGVWVLFTGFVSILETLRVGFVKHPFITHLAGADKLQRDQVASASFFLNTIYSAFISLLLLGISVPLENFWSASPLSTLLQIFAITNLTFVVFSHFEYLQQSVIEFKGVFYSHLTRSVIPTIYIAIMFFTGKEVSLPELTLVILAANIAGTFVCMAFGWNLRHKLIWPGGKLVAGMFRFGRYTFGANLSALAIRNTDTWMIGRMISTAGVAAYNPAIRVANLVEIPTLTVADLVFPKLAEQYNSTNHNETRRLYEKSVGFVMAIMIPMLLFMFFFSDWIIVIIAGSKYIDSGYLLKITAFYCFFIPFARQFGILLDAVRKPELNFVFVLLTALLNLVLNYFFILRWGIAGAAFATLLTYLIRFTAQQIILYKMFDIFTLRVFKYALNFYSEGYTLVKTMVARYG